MQYLKSQKIPRPGNIGPWLVDNQSRDLNNELWLVVYFSDRTVIVDVLNESAFFATFPELHDAQQLVVILTFIQYIIEQPPPKDNVYHADVRSILRALFMHKVHIDASFARSRIKVTKLLTRRHKHF